MIIICLVQVIFLVNGIAVADKVSLEGLALAENSQIYVANFQAAATDKNFIGDYKQVIVDKNNCVNLK